METTTYIELANVVSYSMPKPAVLPCRIKTSCLNWTHLYIMCTDSDLNCRRQLWKRPSNRIITVWWCYCGIVTACRIETVIYTVSTDCEVAIALQNLNVLLAGNSLVSEVCQSCITVRLETSDRKICIDWNGIAPQTQSWVAEQDGNQISTVSQRVRWTWSRLLLSGKRGVVSCQVSVLP